MGTEAEFFTGPTPEKLPPKPVPPPSRTEQMQAEIISQGSRPVERRHDDPGSLLAGLFGAFPGTSSQQAEDMSRSALSAGHNAVVEGKRIQKRAERSLRQRASGQKGRKKKRRRK